MNYVSRFRISLVIVAFLLLWSFASALPPDETYWPYWRGPAANGMAAGDAPLQWSDTQNIRWKADIPGKGHSSPVVWGDQIFLTTAIPTAAAAAAQPAAETGGRRGGFGGGATGPQPEHKFEVLCLDRKTGKVLWQRTAKVAAPHEGYHSTYGSFAANSPARRGLQTRTSRKRRTRLSAARWLPACTPAPRSAPQPSSAPGRSRATRSSVTAASSTAPSSTPSCRRA